MFNTKKIMTLALTSVMMVSAVPMVTMAYSSKSGWVEKDGKWYYYEDGRKIKSNIRYDSDKGGYFLLDSSGVRVKKKGWVTTKTQYNDHGDKYKETCKYYLKSNGTVYVSKWKKIGGKYYYFGYDGKMVKSASGGEYNSKTKVTKFYLAGSNGVRITKKGWHKVKHTYVDSYSGKKSSSTSWYYVKKNGEVARGVYKIGGKKYVFGNDGALAKKMYVSIYNSKTGKYTYYAADKNGIQITKKGWHKYSGSYSYSSNGSKSKYTYTYYVYINKGGKLATGLKKISGKYYYFSPTMYSNSSYYDEATDTMHFFGKSGARKYTIKNYSKISDYY